MKTETMYSNSFEFRDKSNTGTEYTYDNNGNMIRDLNSKIEFIEYDKLDHQGNNRVVAKYDGTIEQTTHYYPYGGILSQSTSQGFQKYKYNLKK